jgi:regulator of sirC expression with transglutaminase-like and TPR domain
MVSADLTLFTHVVGRPEAELDLAQAALLIAEPEYPGLDIPRYLDALDQLGARARQVLDRPAAVAGPPIARVARLLHDELGFSGNAEDYYDPRNSFLNEVLDRKTGIPITLAIVLLEVARRAGLPAHGVSFPGHFLVRAAGPIFIDPFDGRVADRDALRRLNQRATGHAHDPDPRLLEPCKKRDLLVRMLNNLRGIYAAAGDVPRLRAMLERMQVLAPSDEIARQLVQLQPPAAPPRILN